jgi:hypothetical protein
MQSQEGRERRPDLLEGEWMPNGRPRFTWSGAVCLELYEVSC